jgi:hypothetical protein
MCSKRLDHLGVERHPPMLMGLRFVSFSHR